MVTEVNNGNTMSFKDELFASHQPLKVLSCAWSLNVLFKSECMIYIFLSLQCFLSYVNLFTLNSPPPRICCIQLCVFT